MKSLTESARPLRPITVHYAAVTYFHLTPPRPVSAYANHIWSPLLATTTAQDSCSTRAAACSSPLSSLDASTWDRFPFHLAGGRPSGDGGPASAGRGRGGGGEGGGGGSGSGGGGGGGAPWQPPPAWLPGDLQTTGRVRNSGCLRARLVPFR